MPGPIRTALKVDLNKAAAEQPYLHVSWTELLCLLRANRSDRIDGIQIVRSTIVMT
jgi:hypothetical protein